MKILFSHYAIIDKEGFGRSFMLARELVALGNDVTFLTSLPARKFRFPYSKEIRDGVKIIAFPDIVPDFMRRTGFGCLTVLFKFFYLLFRRFDIYHADAGHRPNGGIPIILNKVINWRLVYVSEWWDHFGKGGQFDSKKGFKKITHGYYDLLLEVKEKKVADGVICLSHGMLERAQNLKIKSHLTVINGGADTRAIPFFPKTTLKKKYNIAEPSLTFGFVGMTKGEFADVLPFILALGELKESGLNINWFTTGGYISQEQKELYGIRDELKEFGWVNYKDFPEVLSCADIFVLLMEEKMTSYTRYPNKLGDYFAAGRPVLTNPYGEITRIALKNPDLFYPVAYNSKSVMAAILKIHNEHLVNQPLIDHKRNKIRKYAQENIDWKIKAQELNDFYVGVRLKENL